MASIGKDVLEKVGAKGDERLWLGLDCSTQGLKASLIRIVVNDASAEREFSVEQNEPRHSYSVSFDADLPEYKTTGGCHKHADGRTVTAPTLMWVAALELLFERMKQDGVPLEKIAAISGAGQQHGSVYWKQGAAEVLKGLDAKKSLVEQLSDAFSVKDSPIWMDSSTTHECREFEAQFGGPLNVAKVTGSVAHERFTGHQIAKIRKTKGEEYRSTERISLVSSFAGSLLIGKYSEIDASDGSGMNLMDITSKTWLNDALKICGDDAEELKRKLGDHIVESHQVIGKISPYFVQRYSFSSDALVVAFSGDNPCSLAGLPPLTSEGVEGKSIGVSLGTSDTLFGLISNPKPSTEGHVFCGCVDPNVYMFLLCYSNGSLTREFVRDKYANRSWTEFADALTRTPPGNNDKIGFFFHVPEILPHADPSIYLFDADDNLTILSPKGEPLDSQTNTFSNDEMVRAVVEGQFLSMMVHAEAIGANPDSLSNIVATGGGSNNSHMISILSDIAGVPVLTSSFPNSAALGSAYRALHGQLCHLNDQFVKFGEITKRATNPPFRQVSSPNQSNHAVYKKMIERYKKLEARVLEIQSKN
eukprot:TRINITY_DN377_c0_g2_i1.p1 TRINITY_DN377_c0_g2~~TRINITY_DN377_c0_g2_i1.p1  ORF type:complete len:589 (-),score=147.50 TRINITY_DN377_c0_g2_i1:1106-2872(-)